MQQVVQNVRNGRLRVETVPDPVVRRGQVLVANAASVVSAGTEKALRELASKSLLGKARERPDQVARVLEKVRQEGLATTARQVVARLDRPLTLGYSSAGRVLACGAGVGELRPGDRVASNGPHAGVVCVPRNLCARVPHNVPFDHAAFGVLGAIALQGVRLARLSLGETALVIGLGLVGQLTVGLLKAAGCRVVGTDPDPDRCALARTLGAGIARPELGAEDLEALTAGLGADAVLIAAATRSQGPIRLAAEAVRKKGRVVLLGVVGLELDRRPFYFKEAELVVSCSYGPGRYDPEYEEHGHDYPAAWVRWTEQRNLQAVLDLMGSGQLDVGPLISHRFPVARAEAAYELIDRRDEPFMGIVLEYPKLAPDELSRRLTLSAPKRQGEIGIGFLGAGNFAASVLLPRIRKEKVFRPLVLCSPGGISALHLGRRHGFAAVATDEDEVFADPEVAAVFAVTRHDQHARQVVKALRAGKHVFVEKPLCLTIEELDEITAVLAEAEEKLLMVGFNRRFSPAAARVRDFFAGIAAPLTVAVRFNAGSLPAGHRTQDEVLGGGRIIGEACHGIDLATYLTGSPPVRVFAESAGDDQCFITLRHADDSVSSVAYLAGGDRAFPKERVEVIGGGRVAVIDDFRAVTLVAEGRTKRFRSRQDKGHAAEVAAFARAFTGAPTPIPWEELHAVSLASLLAVRSLREGVPCDLPRPAIADS